MRTAVICFWSGCLLLAAGTVFAGPTAALRRATAPPPRPAIHLSLSPSHASLLGHRAEQRLRVAAARPDGATEDVTDRAQFQLQPAGLATISHGCLVPIASGTLRVTARYAGQEVSGSYTLSIPAREPPISFLNDVLPVLTKVGCNAGACHGSQYGKGGFKLSLRGYDPDLDYRSIRRDARARRVRLGAPEQSLVLRKPSAAVPHGGGLRLPFDSPGYQILLAWLRSGAPGPALHEPLLTGIAVTPPEAVVRPRARQQLLVTARYSSGVSRDVTRWTRFISNQDNIAAVDDVGKVTVVGTGEAVIRAQYGGQVAIARLLVPVADSTLQTADGVPGDATPGRPAVAVNQLPAGVSLIDRPILAKLRRLGIEPSPICTDAVFLRRVSLDLTGALPSPTEARQFLASQDPNKRQKKIDALLERPEYVDCWTYRLGDMLRCSRRSLGIKGMDAFHRYLRDAVARNRRWDELVREMITARGSLWDVGPANYYGVGSGPDEWAESTSQVFMGIRIQCARCHNHPFERWTQADYYHLSAFFARLKSKSGGERGDRAVFVADEGEVKHPRTGAVMSPIPLGVSAAGPRARRLTVGRKLSKGTEPAAESADPREDLARWLTAPENPWFARAIVNRLWGHLMGRGLIEPVDDVRATNPAVNEEALQALADDFVANDYDLKHTLRLICTSATYQRSSEPNATNRLDETQFSRHLVRRLAAEQILDAVVQATGVPEKFSGVPLGARAAQLPDTAVPSYFLDLFGRPARQVVCECEREMQPNLAQTLQIMNGDSVNAKIRAPEGRLAKLLESPRSDAQLLDELFLTTLSRSPTPHERDQALATIRGAASRREGFGDLLWALLNSREFLFSH